MDALGSLAFSSSTADPKFILKTISLRSTTVDYNMLVSRDTGHTGLRKTKIGFTMGPACNDEEVRRFACHSLHSAAAAGPSLSCCRLPSRARARPVQPAAPVSCTASPKARESMSVTAPALPCQPAPRPAACRPSPS